MAMMTVITNTFRLRFVCSSFFFFGPCFCYYLVSFGYKSKLRELLTVSLFFAANIIIGSGSLLGRFLPLPFTNHNGQDWKNTPLSLSPLQVKLLTWYCLFSLKTSHTVIYLLLNKFFICQMLVIEKWIVYGKQDLCDCERGELHEPQLADMCSILSMWFWTCGVEYQCYFIVNGSYS